MNAAVLGILIYVAAQLAIGLAVARGVRTEEDYLLAGRRLGMGLGTFTIFATWFGAETCIGSAGAIYTEGLAGGIADPFGYTACLVLMGVVFAVPLWRLGLTTLGDFFRQRYSPAVERLVVVVIVPGSLLWAAAQIRAFGQVLAASSELGVTVAVTIAAAVVIAYTISGGLLADAVTDLVQGTVLIGGLVCLAIALVAWGGWAESGNWGNWGLSGEPSELGGGWGGFGLSGAFGLSGSSGDGSPSTLLDAVAARLHSSDGSPGSSRSGLLPGLEAWAIPICGSVLAQELVARVIATRSPAVARRACLTGAGLYLAVGLIPVTVGLVGPQLVTDLAHPEQILPAAAQALLPTGLYVLFAGALVSAILSTVDSALLAAGALVSHNVVLSLRPGLREATKLRVARACVFCFGVLAYLMALHAEGVYALVEQASAFGSAGVFVVAVVGLFTRIGGPRAATLTVLAGLGSYVWAAWIVPVETPYLLSLVVSVATYLAVAGVETQRMLRREPRFG